MSTTVSLDHLAVNALRFLSVDAVEAANSGHPGLPLGAAPMGYAVYRRFLRFHPDEPGWADRDRFILSAGHGSALLYSLLHVFGYGVGLEDVRAFRRLGSITPGHPENHLTPGVECTTGPLGQGFANGVGMAMAERWMAARYNVGGAKVVDHWTYGIVSDGDLMEGVAQEAASLAGHLGLGRLIYLYDSNDISLDGPCAKAYTEDVRGKFEAMGWQVLRVEDGTDVEAIAAAVEAARAEESKPSLIEVRTTIGHGSPVAGSSKAHGAPLGAANVASTREALGWGYGAFEVPAELGVLAEEARASGVRLVGEWEGEVRRLEAAEPARAAEYRMVLARELPSDWALELDALEFAAGKVATRDAGKTALNALARRVPFLVGGSADLASSTKTVVEGSGDFVLPEGAEGRNIWFGVREHAMGAVLNGMALHGLRVFGSTFLVFSDYMRGAVRLASLSEVPVLFVFTHDSVFVGEDGPTHQPIEHVAALRTIPGLKVYRPADAYETAAVYRSAMEQKGPSAIILTRQGVPVLREHDTTVAQGARRGGYVLHEPIEQPRVVLMASGSEVGLAVEAAEMLSLEGVQARVVSLPCVELFLEQGPEYVGIVLGAPEGVPVVSVEAGVTVLPMELGRMTAASVGIDRFGASGEGGAVYAHVGMTVERVVSVAKSVLRPLA